MNKEERYFGDIFNLITDPRVLFSQYDHNRNEIKEIFAASGLLDDLANEVKNNGKIDTFISFSAEVPLAARLVFIKELEGHRFAVKEKVAKVEHLLLEYVSKKGSVRDDGRYLVLNALTENLRYSIYVKNNNLFAEERAAELFGMGKDARGRALVEAVVEKLNAKQCFLNSIAEKEHEQIRFTRLLLDGWLVRLSNTPENLPITLSNISFSIAPNNRADVSLLIRDINKRTKTIVTEVIREISRFVGEVSHVDLKGILFLGDVFSNQMFASEIHSCFPLGKDQLHYYRNVDIPAIVSMYNHIDCSQFLAANTNFDNTSEAERQRIQNAIIEEERQLQAAHDLENAKKMEDEKLDAEKRYRDAMGHIEEFERKGDYVQMKDWCETALKVKPDDEEAKRKLNDAVRLLSEEKLRHEQYNEALRRAQQCIEEERYQDALMQSQIALNSVPESVEAKRIRDVARQKIDTSVQIEQLQNRADLYFAQKLYPESLNELKKILTIDPRNQVAEQKKHEIEQLIKEKEFHITSLKQQLQQAKNNSNYAEAKSAISELIKEDHQNQLQWSQELQEIKQEEKVSIEKATKTNTLKRIIQGAVFEEKWKDVVNSCNEFLKISDDSEIEKILHRAKVKIEEQEEKIAKQKEEEHFKDEIDDVKVLIAAHKISEAREKLNGLRKKYPKRADIFKPLYKKIYDAEDDMSTLKHNNRKPIGFGNKSQQVDFFDEGQPSSNKHTCTRPDTTPSKNKQTGDSFFDMDIPHNKKESKTFNEFNF
ncbi:MAG: hypothetical protein IJ764_02695 [Bacteroidales bacterium]|nr:hypothetical protein [Bacteroidales bacterium]